MEKRIPSGGNMEYLFLYTLIVPNRNLLMFRSFRGLVYKHVAEVKNIFPRIYSKRWITFLHSRVSRLVRQFECFVNQNTALVASYYKIIFDHALVLRKITERCR